MRVRPGLEMAYTKQKMEAARKRTMEAKAAAGTSGRVGKTGRMTMQVDKEAYFNAIDRNGGVDDSGKTIWSDDEFRRDMMKRHPEIKVDCSHSVPRVGPLLRRGPKTSDLFAKGRYDDVQGDPDAFIESQRSLVR